MTCVEKDNDANKKYEDAYLGFHTDYLEDCREDEECRKKDVDFKIKCSGNYVELKCGKTVSKWGNIPVEYDNLYYTVEDLDSGTSRQNGWLYLSKAKYVVYWDYVAQKEYRMNLANLRRYVYEQGKDIVKKSNVRWQKYDEEKEKNEISLFFALSVQELQDAGVIIDISDLKYDEDTGKAYDPCPEDANNIF